MTWKLFVTPVFKAAYNCRLLHKTGILDTGRIDGLYGISQACQPHLSLEVCHLFCFNENCQLPALARAVLVFCDLK